ncbi:MAG: hypothetical protein ACJA13_002952 [Paraglaciecola sp.]|jgi:hypothetical protein
MNKVVLTIWKINSAQLSKNPLVPFDYLNYLPSEIPILKSVDTIDHLLPWEFIKR